LHDGGLTLLPNGEYFRARLEQALGHTEPPRQALAVLYLSLDDFTPFINTYGRDVGGVSAEALLANAEFAMYLAKQHKTGFAFVNER
jgi:predicted signal transduction protein with EAL and GGDEF domain